MGRPRTPINPIEKAGLTVLNGHVHATLANMAKEAFNPLYPRALGTDYDNYNRVLKGDIVYSITSDKDLENSLTQACGDSAGGGRPNNKVFAISPLNGQGSGERDPEKLLHKIHIWGFAEEDSNPLFNILARGQFTVWNSGDETINVGDSVIAYAPSMAEALATEDNENGVVKLQTKPFDWRRHSATPKPVYLCLKDVRDKPDEANYLPAYKRACVAFFQSVKDMSLVAMNAAYDQIRGNAGAGRVAFIQRMSDYMDADDGDFDDAFMEQLFVQYADRQDFIEPGRGSASPLNAKQASAAGVFMMASGMLHHEVMKLMLGKAVTTALPGQFFTILR
jgi:hypothetical protein